MKRQTMTIGAAVAAALSGGAAYALPASTITTTGTAVVYFGGATATDTSLEEAFLLKASGLCTNASPAGDDFNAATRIDIYRGTNQRAIVCTKDGGVGGTFTKIVFLKESTGGSGNGTGAIARNQRLQFLDLAGVNGAFTCTASTNVANTATFKSYTNHTGCSPTLGTTTAPPVAGGQVPNAGIADVDPALLGLTATEQLNLSTSAVFDIVFSPAVSLNLYRALQAAQNLTQDDTEANMPSITESQLRALYNGQVRDWTAYFDVDGAQLVVDADADTVPESAAAGIVVPASSVVKVCRRGNSSGTQASFATQFSRQGVNNSVVPGVQTFIEPDGGSLASGTAWTTDANTSFDVWAGASSGDVRSCLDAHHDRSNWAIGVLSTENRYQLDDGVNNAEIPWPGTPPVSADPRKEEWRWVKTSGVAPTLEKTANGDYDFFTENVINKATSIAADDAQVVNRLIAVLGSPTVIAGINVGHQNTHGDGGLLAVPGTPDANPPFNQADLRTNPTNTQRRTTNYINPNNKVDSWEISPTVIGGTEPKP